MTTINGIEKIFENMTSLVNLAIRFDYNKMESSKNPGQLKNLLNKSALKNVKELAINVR